MNDTKPWYQSTGVLGGIASAVAMLVMVLKFIFGVDISDLAPALSSGFIAVLGLIGTIVAIWGRVAATKKIQLLVAAALLLFFFAPVGFAGTGEVVSINEVATATAEESPKPWYEDLFGAIQGASDARSLQLVLYPTYAKDLGNHWGAGGALLYPLGEFLFAGARFDYLDGNYFAASVGVGAKADIDILGKKFTPFAITGAVMPLSGAGDTNHELGAIVGTGVSTVIWENQAKNSRVSAFGALEYWSQYPGIQIYHAGAQLSLAW